MCVCLFTEDERPGVYSRLSPVSEQLERLPCSVPTIPGGCPLRRDGRQDVRCGQMVSSVHFSCIKWRHKLKTVKGTQAGSLDCREWGITLRNIKFNVLLWMALLRTQCTNLSSMLVIRSANCFYHGALFMLSLHPPLPFLLCLPPASRLVIAHHSSLCTEAPLCDYDWMRRSECVTKRQGGGGEQNQLLSVCLCWKNYDHVCIPAWVFASL